MEEIKSAVKSLLSVEKEKEMINEFAREAYNEKFKDMKHQSGTYHGYDGFEILNENTIRVFYEFGATYGDFDYRESFDIELK